MPGDFVVEWGQEPHIDDPSAEEELPTQADTEVYSSDTAFPASAVTIEGNGRLSGISLAEVEVTPVRYYPQSGRIEACRSMVVRIDTEAGLEPTQPELAAQPFDETVSEIVHNFGQAEAWYQGEDAGETQSLSTLGTGDAADYVVITTEALVAATEPLRAYKESQGLSVETTTVEWL